ncbi:SGNH/GDSL hydrolase family protein [Streptomyces pharetrae]|uniref:SGNH/GDSL hydrolase family protein n=1 Tax=Streptomyces pharetrae TaxID=291370 RepID=UPI0036560232
MAKALGSTAVAFMAAVGTGSGASADVDGTHTRAARLSMVNLGDSYSAGYTRLAGEPAESDEPGKSGCERTLRSYPYVLKDELADRLGRTVNVTCGGATTENVLATPQRPVGHASLDRLGLLQADPLAPFPAHPPQIEAVAPDTDIITVGIGGNDYFSRLATTCLEADAASDNPNQCQDNLRAGKYAGLGLPADDPHLDRPKQALISKYGTLLGELHARAPHARMYVVGYPSVLPVDTSTCARNSQELFTLNKGDITWLRQILDGINAAIASATAGAAERGMPTEFVDTYRATVGKDACAPRDTKWVEGYTERIGVVGVGGWGEPALIHPNHRYHHYVAGQLALRIRHDFERR